MDGAHSAYSVGTSRNCLALKKRKKYSHHNDTTKGSNPCLLPGRQSELDGDRWNVKVSSVTHCLPGERRITDTSSAPQRWPRTRAAFVLGAFEAPGRVELAVDEMTRLVRVLGASLQE